MPKRGSTQTRKSGGTTWVKSTFELPAEVAAGIADLHKMFGQSPKAIVGFGLKIVLAMSDEQRMRGMRMMAEGEEFEVELSPKS